MQLPLKELVIKGLHGHRDVTIPIRDGRIVMVGRNGLGKTTVVNIIYLALSQQWDRLIEYNFSELQLAFPGQRLILPREIGDSRKSQTKKIRSYLSNLLSASQLSSLGSAELHEIAHLIGGDVSPEMLHRVSTRFRIPFDVLYGLKESSFQRFSPFESETRKKADEVLSSYVSDSQVLYLPTYRRIEKDLKLIVPGLEEQLEGYHRRRSLKKRESARTYIELVEFGMEDVERTFRRIRSELTESSRAQLNTLAGGYLRDVIRGQGADYDPKEFSSLDPQEVSQILGRVEESTLNENDKERLQYVILELASQAGGSQKVEDRYIAHFFSKLIEVHRALEVREKAISQFVSVCNGYLADKEIAFDAKTYSINIVLKDGQPIGLKDLSSGEKQIVSLFSHLYLHEDESFILLIDEPELSLSVPWQKLLLPDIWASGRVRFLGAVTHSPFIFENSLDPYSIDLAQCITTVAGESR